jgi:hypothetical protein
MCRKTTCSCGKISWAGCGQHVDSVLGNIKDEDRCPAVRTGMPPIPPSQSRDPCPALGGKGNTATSTSVPLQEGEKCSIV